MSEQRTIRFRVWDGERMHTPDDVEPDRLTLWMDGTLTSHEAPHWENAVPGAVVMLSTGLTDADGREVYEGDLLPVGLYGPLPVAWSAERAAWVLGDRVCYLADAVESGACITGNIHENPDLL